MFNVLLNSISAADKIKIGVDVTLRGMGTVFAVLILIWGIIEFLHLILGDKTKPAPNKQVETKIDTKEATVLPNEEIANERDVTPAVDDYELIAVITAAVAAASGSSPSSFRVVSFKRANNKFAGK